MPQAGMGSPRPVKVGVKLATPHQRQAQDKLLIELELGPLL